MRAFQYSYNAMHWRAYLMLHVIHHTLLRASQYTECIAAHWRARLNLIYSNIEVCCAGVKQRDFLLRGGETAARHPLLSLDPRIPFSYQEKVRGNQKCKENSK